MDRIDDLLRRMRCTGCGPGPVAPQRTRAPVLARAPRAQPNDFERVASLVLLALLCTTLVAVA